MFSGGAGWLPGVASVGGCPWVSGAASVGVGGGMSAGHDGVAGGMSSAAWLRSLSVARLQPLRTRPPSASAAKGLIAYMSVTSSSLNNATYLYYEVGHEPTSTGMAWSAFRRGSRHFYCRWTALLARQGDYTRAYRSKFALPKAV